MDAINLLHELESHGDLWCLDVSRLSGWLATREKQAANRVPKVQGRIAIVPVHGVLTKRGGWFGTSTDAVGRAVSEAAQSSHIVGIVLDVDSPGGSSMGTPEMSDVIFAAREAKPIVAVANPMAASAGIWAASSASKLFVTPSGEAGSVGVWSMHVDYSKLLENEGIEVNFISAGKYKVEGNPYEPLTDEARAEFQRSVDEVHSQFVGAMARNRGVSRMQVRSDFGEGRMLESDRAVAAGMADGVRTLDSVLSSMQSTARTGKRTDAELTERLCNAWVEGKMLPIGNISTEVFKARRERERRTA